MIGVIVVLFKPTDQEIRNISMYKDEVDKILIIDNSPINHQVIISNLIGLSKDIQYVSYTENIGLCKALNQGIRKLASIGCEWIVAFDADSQLETNIFSVYRQTIAEYPDIISVAVFAPQHSFDRGIKKIYSGYREVDWAMTSGWLINADIFLKNGGFFEPLFLDGLDLDYCYFVREQGYKVIECGEAVIKHHPGETKETKVFNKTIKYGYAPPDRYLMQARCLVWTIRRYKKIFDIKMYVYKWVKVILLFDNTYIKRMVTGTKEGLSIYRKYKSVR